MNSAGYPWRVVFTYPNTGGGSLVRADAARVNATVRRLIGNATSAGMRIRIVLRRVDQPEQVTVILFDPGVCVCPPSNDCPAHAWQHQEVSDASPVRRFHGGPTDGR